MISVREVSVLGGSEREVKKRMGTFETALERVKLYVYDMI